MVDDLDADHVGQEVEAVGEDDISGGGPEVAGGVVVQQDDGARAQQQGGADDGVVRDIDVAHAAGGDDLEAVDFQLGLGPAGEDGEVFAVVVQLGVDGVGHGDDVGERNGVGGVEEVVVAFEGGGGDVEGAVMAVVDGFDVGEIAQPIDQARRAF